MNFWSLGFARDFSLFLVIYWMVPSRWRWAVCLAGGGGYLYRTVPQALPLLMLGSLLVLLLRFFEGKPQRWRNGVLTFGVLLALLPLVFWKHAALILPEQRWVIPLGLSFFTFRLVAWLVDIHRGDAPALKHWGLVPTFLGFFPQWPMGPIERARDLLPQMERPVWAWSLLLPALDRLALALFKKMVVADRLALLVEAVLDQPQGSGFWVLAGIYAFAFQIYFDFSAFTDMAVGLSLLLGLRSAENFQNPYGARSVAQFWQRWHISLSAWLRDYLFLPLAYRFSRLLGERTQMKASVQDRWVYTLAILLTMGVAGWWHGSTWMFLAWGLLFGVYQSLGQWLKKSRNRFWKKRLAGGLLLRARPLLQNLLTFHLVLFAWLFFRLRDGAALASWWSELPLHPQKVVLGQVAFALLVLLLAGGVSLLRAWAIHPFLQGGEESSGGRSWVALGAWSLMVALILFVGADRGNPFIYEQF